MAQEFELMARNADDQRVRSIGQIVDDLILNMRPHVTWEIGQNWQNCRQLRKIVQSCR